MPPSLKAAARFPVRAVSGSRFPIERVCNELPLVTPRHLATPGSELHQPPLQGHERNKRSLHRHFSPQYPLEYSHRQALVESNFHSKRCHFLFPDLRLSRREAQCV